MLNPEDAPPGYRAVVSAGYCDNCAFLDQNRQPACALFETLQLPGSSCAAAYREDGCEVHFVADCKTGTTGPLGQRIREI